MDRKQLLRLMPRNQSDSVAAKAMVDLGYPTVKPVLKDMLHCLRRSSEVADIFCEFFAQLGSAVIEVDWKRIEESKDSLLKIDILPRWPIGSYLMEVVAKGLESNDLEIRNRILTGILPRWPIEAITPIKHSLTLLVTHHDDYNNDLYCIKLLINTQLVDPAWLFGWLEFKQERLTDRLDLIQSLQLQIEDRKNGFGKDDNITTD